MVASSVAPTGGLACNPGVCPDRESIQQPFVLQSDTQCTETHQPGLYFINFRIRRIRSLNVYSTPRMQLACLCLYSPWCRGHYVFKVLVLSLDSSAFPHCLSIKKHTQYFCGAQLQGCISKQGSYFKMRGKFVCVC